MIKYTETIDSFEELQNLVWGYAVKVLEEISNAGKEDEFMEHLEYVFDDSFNETTLTDINDYISFDWEEIYTDIGMEEDEENE